MTRTLRFLALAALTALVTVPSACGRHTLAGLVPGGWRYASPPPPVVGRHAMVVSEHPLSSEVGAEILRRGGNAIDAAVAVGFAQAVVNPRAGNIGGGGFLVYRTADGHTYALDYRETAPAAATRDMYLDSLGELTDRSVLGALAAGVPGSVAGLWEMHRRFGRLPWRELVQPAIDLARGHALDSVRARVIGANREDLARFPSSAAVFLRGGEAPSAGDTLRQPDLARTLERIAEQGADGFYRGETADLIVAQMRRSGGIITTEDLAGYRAIWREPIQSTYRGWHIIAMPPSSSGGVTLTEILNILEGYRLPDFGNARLLHLEIEAMRRGFTDRNRYLGDPAFVQMPIDRLTSKAYAAELRRGISVRRATAASAMPAVVEGTETTHYSIVDPDGDAVAITTTLNGNFGAKVVVGGAGFLLNNEMDDFAAKPGAPNMFGLVQGEANAIQPGKRMLSAMTPTIVLDPEGRLALVVGAPGGPTIITAVFQVISNVIDHGMTLSEAVYAPRIHHQALPDSIQWEPNGIAPGVRRQLERMGHAFRAKPGYMALINAIRVTPEGLEGVPDPRTSGAAVGF
jgi:gamma-glutamyltranspeptidase/glutathione hydrolase